MCQRIDEEHKAEQERSFFLPFVNGKMQSKKNCAVSLYALMDWSVDLLMQRLNNIIFLRLYFVLKHIREY